MLHQYELKLFSLETSMTTRTHFHFRLTKHGDGDISDLNGDEELGVIITY